MLFLGHAQDLVEIHRQADGEARTFTERAFRGNRAVMVLNDLVADGEAQPGPDANAFRGESWVEDFGEVFGGDPGAVVSNRDGDPVVLDSGSDRNGALVRNCLARVVQKIQEDLIQAARINRDFGELAIVPDDLDMMLDLMMDERQRVLEPVVDVDALELGLVEAREAPQPPDDLRHARGAGVDDLIRVVDDAENL